MTLLDFLHIAGGAKEGRERKIVGLQRDQEEQQQQSH